MRIIWAAMLCARYLLMLIVVFSIAGCGGKVVPTGDVRGEVTFKGEPVASGSISFISTDGKAAAADLDEEGRYALRKVVTGEYKVLVLPPPLPPPGKPGTVKTKGMADFPGHPKRYRSDLTTDLKADVTEGENELSFELQPDPAGGTSRPRRTR